MSKQQYQLGFSGRNWTSVGIGTKYLVIALVVYSLIAAIFERTGIPLQKLSMLHVPAIFPGLELWRLLTSLFVEVQPFGLIISAVVMWFLCGWFEDRYSTKALIQFFFIAGIGSGLIAVPLTYLLNFILAWIPLFRETGIAAGPSPIFDAIIAAMAIVTPNSNILLGFVLPIKARTVVYIIIGFSILSALMSGASSLASVLGGLIMGYLLVTGWWRPSKLLRSCNEKRRRKEFQKKFRTIHGGNHNSHTLH